MIGGPLEGFSVEDPPTAPDTLSMDEFVALVAADLRIPGTGVGSASRFREDLQLDAIQMLRLTLLLDSFGTPLGVEELARVRRMGDAYRRYVDRRARSRYGEFVCEGSAGTDTSVSERIMSPLISHRTRQRALSLDDYPYVRSLINTNEAVLLWRRRSLACNPEAFGELLWRSVLVQHLVLEAAVGAPCGLVTAYDADLVNGTAWIALLLDQNVQGLGWPLEAAALFVNHLFRTWPLRKLYAQVLPQTVTTFASGLGGLMNEEGRLVAHEYVAGAWCDVHVVSLFRDAWLSAAPTILKKIVGTRALLT